MCGLVGMMSYDNGFYKPDVDMFKSMLLMNAIRGDDSTGVFGVDVHNKVDWAKVIGGPSHLFDSNYWTKFERRVGINHYMAFGHGRLATQGDVTVNNAHPFNVDHIYLIHNGTLTNFHALKSRHNLNKINVDSLLCAHLFAKMSPEEVIKEIAGAYAFIWYNAEEKTLNILRNDERPLYMYHRSDKKQFLISSERSTFMYLEDKYNMKGEISYFGVDNHYTFPIKEGKFFRSELKKPEPPKAKPHSYASSGYVSNLPQKQEKGDSRYPVGQIPNTTVKVGVWVPFWFMDEKELAPKRWYIKGLLEEDEESDIHAMLSEPAPQAEHGVLYGKVARIICNSKFNGALEYDIHVNEIKDTDPSNSSAEKTYMLMDGSHITYNDAKIAIAKGCAGCSKPLSLGALNYTTLHNNRLYCLQCDPVEEAKSA